MIFSIDFLVALQSLCSNRCNYLPHFIIIILAVMSDASHHLTVPTTSNVRRPSSRGSKEGDYNRKRSISMYGGLAPASPITLSPAELSPVRCACPCVPV